MYQRIRNLLFHTLVPAVLAVLILPMAAFAQEASCTVSIPGGGSGYGKPGAGRYGI